MTEAQMSDVHTYSSDVAFTPAVKAIQTRKGSRESYAHVEERGGWRTEIDENLAGFLAEHGYPTVEEHRTTEESLIFSLPRELRHDLTNTG